MNSPPRFALWLLARLGDEALTGDLLEHFGDRHRSPAWFRRQVFAAIAMRARWPEVVFALAGTLAVPFVWRASLPVRFLFPWAAMAWPWSQMVFELGSYLMVSIAPLGSGARPRCPRQTSMAAAFCNVVRQSGAIAHCASGYARPVASAAVLAEGGALERGGRDLWPASILGHLPGGGVDGMHAAEGF